VIKCSPPSSRLISKRRPKPEAFKRLWGNIPLETLKAEHLRPALGSEARQRRGANCSLLIRGRLAGPLPLQSTAPFQEFALTGSRKFWVGPMEIGTARPRVTPPKKNQLVEDHNAFRPIVFSRGPASRPSAWFRTGCLAEDPGSSEPWVLWAHALFSAFTSFPSPVLGAPKSPTARAAKPSHPAGCARPRLVPEKRNGTCDGPG